MRNRSRIMEEAVRRDTRETGSRRHSRGVMGKGVSEDTRDDREH